MKLMKKNSWNYIILVILLSLFVNINIVYADNSASLNISGNGTVNVNSEFTVSLNISNISGSTVNASNGSLSITNQNCVTVNKIEGLNGTTATSSKFMGSYLSGLSADTEIVKFSFKAGSSACSFSINITGAKITFMDGTSIKNQTANKTINIVVPDSSSTASNDATLKTLAPSNGTLSPSFASGTITYNLEVDNSLTSLNFTATANDSGATISNTSCALTGDTTNCVITVTAADKATTKNYTVKVTKKSNSSGNTSGTGGSSGTGDTSSTGGTSGTGSTTGTGDTKSSDNKLKSLTISGYTIKFDPNKDTYSLEVENNVTSLNVTAEANDSKSTVSIKGNTSLKVGTNNITITVTAENNSVKIYTVKVVRKSANGTNTTTSKSSENRIKSLIIAEGSLSPVFSKDVNSYDIVVASDVNKLTLNSTLVDSKSTLKVYNNENFIVGETKAVLLEVTAEDGSQKTYIINVKKSEKNVDNKLSGIEISGHELSPKFKSDVYSYTTKVDKDDNYINVSTSKKNKDSKVEYSINGGAYQENSVIPLEEGNNILVIKVTDGELSNQYVVKIARESSKDFSVLGTSVPSWFILVFIPLSLILLFVLLFLLMKKKSNPKIEINPEFNFNSKNQDNDNVDGNGVINQSSSMKSSNTNDSEKEIPYDPYDSVVTKDELMDAIIEKDPDKLRILYKQELLNREKEKVKAKKEAKEISYEEGNDDDD